MTPAVWAEQPQIPTRTDATGIGAGLFASIDASQGGYDGALDAMAWATATSTASPPAIRSMPGGVGYNTTGAVKDLIRIVNGPLAAADPWTFAFTHQPTANVSLSQAFGFGMSIVAGAIDSASLPYGTYRACLNFNSNYYFWGSNADWDTGVAWNTDGAVHTAMFVHDGATIYFWLDGVMRASSARPGGLVATPTGRACVIGNKHGSGTNAPSSTFRSARAWNRALRPDEARKYAANEFSVYAPMLRGGFAPVSAGGGSYSLTADSGSYTLTGQSAGLLAGRVLAAAQGSYTLSGQDVALLKGNVLTAAQGSYALTGQDVGLLRGLLLSAAQGSYALTGQDATLTYTPLGAFSLTADQGSYALTGQSVSLLWGPVLAAGQGSYTLNGQDATLTYTPVGAYILTAGQGSYSLTGQDVLLQWGHVLAAAQGSYTLTGQDVSLARGLLLAAAQGSYTLSGQAAAFARTYVMSAGYGSYALTGQIVSLTYSGAALEALEYLLLISHITQSMSKTSKVTMEVDLISRIQQQLDGSSSI